MITWGISAGFHDAALSVIDGNKILFAAHSERYSHAKHDKDIGYGILGEALRHGEPSAISYYERPWLKKTRQLYAGQYQDAFSLSDITVRRYLKSVAPAFALNHSPSYHHQSHHLSHAAAAFQTSPFTKATVVIIDAIGEWDTISIYGAEYRIKEGVSTATYKPLWKQRYPHSIGLFYTAMTAKVGLRPLDEEYILMGMAGYGKSTYANTFLKTYIRDQQKSTFTMNLHAGIPEDTFPADADEYDIAASAQRVAERLIQQVMLKAAAFGWSDNLAYSGGVALNCSANRHLGQYFKNIWLMPNPGDAGSSLGAAALVTKEQLDWQGPFLGTRIYGAYPVQQLITALTTDKIVGVANGRAEFGPRALGNRSLLADPRGPEIKDKVNEIKRRQQFRPFAPVILEEHVSTYFEMPVGFSVSPYMQVTAKCKFPELFPAIVHVDGTSRVQTVPRDCRSGIRQLLEKWYTLTNCPMLLNTSLNIRGEPMVNTREDANRFEKEYGVKVFS